MKFLKGVILGGMLVTGAYFMCNEECMIEKNKNRIMKKGKKVMKKIGII